MPEMSDLCCLGKTRVDNLLNLQFINISMNLIAEDVAKLGISADLHLEVAEGIHLCWGQVQTKWDS